MPMSKRCRGVHSAGQHETLHLWRQPMSSAGGIEEEDEEEDTEFAQASKPTLDAEGAQAVNKAQAAIRYMEEIPTVRQLKDVWSKITSCKEPCHIWQHCRQLPGFRGEGYSLKNFALLFFSNEQMQIHSSAGIGAKRCYNVANGARRVAPMGEETLQLMVNRDRVLAAHFWSGNFLGSGVFNQLEHHERDLGAVVLTSNRCAMDKISWKIAHNFAAPRGFASWREYSRMRRSHAA